jgi:UDP-N-acetylmuramate dehydrogenase
MLPEGGELLRRVIPSRLVSELSDLPGEIRFDVSLAPRTTIGVGGKGACLIVPRTVDALVEAIRLCRQCGVRYILLGAGSNLLFSDHGYPGVVIATEGLSGSVIEGESVKAFCGEPLPSLLAAVGRAGVRSLDFLAGIPGSVGGAIAMNAGIPGRSIGEMVDRVAVLSPQGEVRRMSAGDCRFTYRRSAIRDERLPVLWARLRLDGEPYDRAAILAQRRASQPLKSRSAGCIFKNPLGLSAGRLIDRAGLKGFRVGMAKVSEKHANFIINLGGARSAEIRKLIDIVRQKVYKSFRIPLELEIEVIDG